MIHDENISYFTLPSGLRCVHFARPDAAVEIAGIVVDAGSRDDGDGADGLAHFVEHTIFKGTSHRSSWHIINRMEAIGGELNAFTSKEATTVYSLFPSGNFDRAAELIADLVCDSVFPERELAKEREVVADEIASYLDIPSEAIYDDFEDFLFRSTPLGHNILGTEASLATFDSALCRKYLSEYYVATNMVMFYCGPLDMAKMKRIVLRRFARLPMGTADPLQVASKGTALDLEPARFDHVRELDIHQSHVLMGRRISGMFSSDRFAMGLLVNIIGGPGMSSMLNVALRERRGLVYSVDASTSLFTDTGVFNIYFGCDHDDVRRCRNLVSDTLNRLADSSLSSRTVDKFKRQYIGQLTISFENIENSVLSMARSTLYRGSVVSADVVRESIMEVTPDKLREMAQFVAPSNLSTLIFGQKA